MTCIGLAFAGPIGSGKTTLATAIAQSLGGRVASFGRVVRAEVHRAGLDSESREVLQAIGNTLVDRGWERFCRLVLADAGWKEGECLVVDGVRHAEALDTLRSLVKPMPLFLIYVQADQATREARLLERDALQGLDLPEIDRHETESQVHTRLSPLADLIVDGTLPLASNQEIVLEWIRYIASG